MSIRFIQPWNGYQVGQVATLSNEAALIAGGIARDSDEVDGPLLGARNLVGTNAAGTALVGIGHAIGRSIACLGDSITERNWVNTTDYGTNNTGYMTWANVFLKKRLWFPYANNFGYSGETTETIKTHVSDVIAVAPDYCVVLIGINDIAAADPFATITANLQEIYDGLLNAGITPVAMTIWPEDYASITADERKVKYRVNTWIRETCLRDRRILLCDPFPLLVDSASATGAAVTGYLADTLHPAAKGAFWAGWALYKTLDPILPTTPTICTTQADLYDATYNPTGNLLANGILDGTAGTETGAGVSGDTATSWTLYRTGTSGGGTSTCVGSKTTVTLDNGQTIPAQTITVNCATSGNDERFMLYQYVTTNYLPGEQVWAEIDVDVTSSINLKYLKFQIVDYDGLAITLTVPDLRNPTDAGYLPDGTWSGRLRTPVFTVGPDNGSQALRIQLLTSWDGTSAASGVIKAYRASVRKMEA